MTYNSNQISYILIKLLLITSPPFGQDKAMRIETTCTAKSSNTYKNP